MNTLIQQLGVIIAFILSITIIAPVHAQSLDLTAKSAILIEASTGKVIYEKNAEQRLPPASTTKLMTLIAALETGKMDDIVTASENAAQTEGSTIWLGPGEKMKMLDLLYGIILVSGNDATVAVAEHISGSVPKFAALMNRKASVIGAKDTHFTNPNGLPDEQHYSTAHDLARITAYGYKNPMFTKIVGTINKVIPWPGKDHDRDLYNENKLLWQYEGGNGGKTGYTDAAGRCLVAGAKRNGVQLIAVVLDSDYMWTDSIRLLDYGFTQVSPYTVVKQGDILKTVQVKDGMTDKLPLATAGEIVVGAAPGEWDKFKSAVEVDKVVAPIKAGQKLGKVKVLYNGKEISSTDLVAAHDVERKSFFGRIWGSLWGVLTFMIRNFA
jgi:serine-type D-Ala-D-Ala carboxypeptidase (penicillin-binding protein 5/6)